MSLRFWTGFGFSGADSSGLQHLSGEGGRRLGALPQAACSGWQQTRGGVQQQQGARRRRRRRWASVVVRPPQKLHCDGKLAAFERRCGLKWAPMRTSRASTDRYQTSSFKKKKKSNSWICNFFRWTFAFSFSRSQCFFISNEINLCTLQHLL